MKYIYTFMLFCFSVTIYAQTFITESVISNAGGINSNTSNLINFTIGETFVTSIANTFAVEQGFWASSTLLNTLSAEHIKNEDTFITVYPNPATSFFTIKTSTINDYKISLFNTNGQELLTKKIMTSSLENQIDVSALAQGIYMLSISNTKHKKTIKLIKK